jgi:hypothetical protein
MYRVCRKTRLGEKAWFLVAICTRYRVVNVVKQESSKNSAVFDNLPPFAL